jgi:hypothetical protein
MNRCMLRCGIFSFMKHISMQALAQLFGCHFDFLFLPLLCCSVICAAVQYGLELRCCVVLCYSAQMHLFVAAYPAIISVSI